MTFLMTRFTLQLNLTVRRWCQKAKTHKAIHLPILIWDIMLNRCTFNCDLCFYTDFLLKVIWELSLTAADLVFKWPHSFSPKHRVFISQIKCSVSNPNSTLPRLVCKCIYGPTVPDLWNQNFNDSHLWHVAESGLDLLPAWLWYTSYYHITLWLRTF